MKFQVLASGSKGNMTYIESNNTKLILDCGISLKEAQNRSNIDFNNIDAILVTHAHIDHVKFLQTFLKHTQATLYINKDTLNEAQKKFDIDFNGAKIQYLENNKNYLINDIGVFTMQLSHDTDNCNGFVFVEQVDSHPSLAYITDTGLVPLIYFDVLKKMDSIILESNHDIQMLNESDRPRYLKDRILSFKGHLSNITCGEILNKILESKKLNKVILAHISEDCNEEKLAIDTVLDKIEGDYIPRIIIAKQWESIEMMDVKNEN